MTGDLQNVAAVLEHNSHFYLRDRACHVVSEHLRVEEFIRVSQTGDLGTLGRLMDESQESCKSLYSCSSDNLDSIIQIAKKSNALGARVTGAGWGGCAVLMVYRSEADSVMTALKDGFYK